MNKLLNRKSNIIASTATMAHRNLLKTLHNPDELLDVVVQPVLFMLLFGYLFSGAIYGDVSAYLKILVPGILMQSLISAASGSGTQISSDMKTGIYDRLKSLPISQTAPLAGQLLADILRLLIATIASLSTGFLMGWRPAAGWKWVLVVVVLDIFLGWALSWIFALYGLVSKSPTLVESVSLMTMLLLTFLSNAFVPVRTLPTFMKILVSLNPVSYVISASRTMLNHGYWPIEAWIVLGAGVLVVAIFAPLTVLIYHKKSN